MSIERRIGFDELARTVTRIDGRTARIEAALFEEHGIITRVVLLETRAADDAADRRVNRIVAAIATLVGSAVGAVAGFLNVHH